MDVLVYIYWYETPDFEPNTMPNSYTFKVIYQY